MQADSVGGITPAVLASLRPGEKILSAHGLMLYKEPTVQIHRRTMKSLGVSTTHLLAMHNRGDSEEGYFFAEFEGPGHVTFSRDKGGEVRILNLAAGQTLRLRDGHLICFDETVRYSPMVLGQWVNPVANAGGGQRTNYLFADELTGPGTIVFQSFGNVLSFELKPGEWLRTSTTALLAVANTVGLRIGWLGGLGGVGGILASGATPTVGGLLGAALGGSNLPNLFGGGSLGGNVAVGGGATPPNVPVVEISGPGTVMVHSGV